MSVNTYYSQLMAHSKQLDIIHVIGLPRSRGTAVHLALAQAEEVSGQINEPFFYPDLKGRHWSLRSEGQSVRTFEQGCEHLWKKFQSLKDGDKKITIVAHDLTQDLTDEEFILLANLAKHVVLCVRDPLLNARSMFERHVNDKLADAGGDKLSFDQCLKLMKGEAPVPEGKPSRQEVFDHFAHEFQIPWENMLRFHEISQDLYRHKVTVLDVECLTSDPETKLRWLVEETRVLTYTNDMVHNWKKFVGRNFDCIITKQWGEFAHHNAWNGPVRNSDKLQFKTAEVRKEDFPAETLDVISFSQKAYDFMQNYVPH